MANKTIDTIVRELQKTVGLVKVVLFPDVPPGISLEALKQEYGLAALRLKTQNGVYKPTEIDTALQTIYDDLTASVYG